VIRDKDRPLLTRRQKSFALALVCFYVAWLIFCWMLYEAGIIRAELP
jgi:hypothetical protein